MKTFSPHPEKVSHTFPARSRSARQAPLSQLLQAYTRHTEERKIALENNSTPFEIQGQKTAQFIMSAAEFRELTPAQPFKPRKMIRTIDTALDTYIHQKNEANANALITAIQNYTAHSQNVLRVNQANQLLTRAQQEKDILHVIGDAHGFLVDGLIEQVGITYINDLITLATLITPANALSLPALLSAVGIAHIPLLVTMIPSIGGLGQIDHLKNVINYRHPGEGNLASDLAVESAGDGAKFKRLAEEVPMFQQQAAPAAEPAGVTTAIGNYNAAFNAAPLPLYTSLITQLKHIASDIEAQPGLINAGKLGGLKTKIAALTTANTIPNAQKANQMLTKTIGADVTAAESVAVNAAKIPLTAILNSINTAKDTFDALDNRVTYALPVSGVNWPHFLTRHTAHYFNFAEIKPDNTQWNVSLGPDVSNWLETQFIYVLTNLQSSHLWLQSGHPIPHQAIPAGGQAQIAGLKNAANQIRIGQFFPEHSPGNNIYDHPASTMRAIQKLL